MVFGTGIQNITSHQLICFKLFFYKFIYLFFIYLFTYFLFCINHLNQSGCGLSIFYSYLSVIVGFPGIPQARSWNYQCMVHQFYQLFLIFSRYWLFTLQFEPLFYSKSYVKTKVVLLNYISCLLRIRPPYKSNVVFNKFKNKMLHFQVNLRNKMYHYKKMCLFLFTCYHMSI